MVMANFWSQIGATSIGALVAAIPAIYISHLAVKQQIKVNRNAASEQMRQRAFVLLQTWARLIQARGNASYQNAISGTGEDAARIQFDEKDIAEADLILGNGEIFDCYASVLRALQQVETKAFALRIAKENHALGVGGTNSSTSAGKADLDQAYADFRDDLKRFTDLLSKSFRGEV